MPASRPTRRSAVILAAGRGTRMRSARPKVLHEIAGRPLLAWVLDAARAAGCERQVVVVGHGAAQVRAHFEADDVTWVMQDEQLGTGHALAQAAPLFVGAGTDDGADGEEILLVLSGDVPLLAPATLERLAAEAADSWGAMAVAVLAEPGRLGRVLTTPGGGLERIVEAADATADELAVDLINAGIYALRAPQIFAALDRLDRANAQGELYLTDALSGAAARGERIAVVALDDPAEALGVNDRRDLANAHRALIDRRLGELAAAGVTILEPARTVVEPRVRVGEDTVIHADVSLTGHTRVGSGCVLHQGVWLRDTVLDEDVVVEPYSVLDGARVGPGCSVGPFARLRPASVLLTGARVGNFVELKKTQLGEGSKASHLTYLGDSTVGDGANIGAGVVTCNYDGVDKHATEIGDGAFVGSDTMLVAPVEVGRGATTAAGSVITNDVPPGALAVGRARQRNIPEWAERKRRTRSEKNPPKD